MQDTTNEPERGGREGRVRGEGGRERVKEKGREGDKDGERDPGVVTAVTLNIWTLKLEI